MLGDHPVFPIVLSTDMAASRAFYHEKLGLEIAREDAERIMFKCGNGSVLAVSRSTTGTRDTQTQLAWRVPDLHAALDDLRARGVRTADGLPNELVYAGMSFGESIAQELAQTRPGARGAILMYSAIPISGEWAFGPWPDGVPVQIHGMDNDPIFVGEGDIDAAREIVGAVDDAELFLYPGDQHYFADSSLPSYDPEPAGLLMTRVLDFLARV
jgi:dienelactone hydrolase